MFFQLCILKSERICQIFFAKFVRLKFEKKESFAKNFGGTKGRFRWQSIKEIGFAPLAGKLQELEIGFALPAETKYPANPTNQ